MTAPAGKLNRSSAWFAAGREVSRALALPSDGAFRLYIYFCLKADRRTGQMKITHGELAKAVRRSRRSIIIIYMEELQRQRVYRVQKAANQHDSGQIEICDAFWPYQKTRTEAPEDRASYVVQVQRLMGTRRCVARSFAPADKNLASALFQRGVTIQQVARGFLLGCARKYSTLLNNKSNELIMSFSYFQSVIEEAGELQMPEDY